VLFTFSANRRNSHDSGPIPLNELKHNGDLYILMRLKRLGIDDGSSMGIPNQHQDTLYSAGLQATKRRNMHHAAGLATSRNDLQSIICLLSLQPTEKSPTFDIPPACVISQWAEKYQNYETHYKLENI
jgi:hypothetical protein